MTLGAVRRARTAIAVAVACLVALAAPVGAQDTTTAPTSVGETCVEVGARFVYRGGTPASVTVPVEPVAGVVEAVTVVVDDPPHPLGASQSSERVAVSLGAAVVGTTPDLPDDETGASYVLPVGGTLEFDTVTVTHAPDLGPDSITAVSVCVAWTPTSASSTTTTSTTTTTTTSTTTTTTTTPPIVAPPPSSSTTSTVPPAPGQGSFAAACAAVGSDDLASLIWTAEGTLPSTVVSGDPVTLGQQRWSVSVPASVLEAARSLGLVDAGDVVPVSIGATISARDTAEQERSAPGLSTSVVVAVGADGTALPAVATVAAPDMDFTATGDRIDVRIATATATLDLGGESVELSCTFAPDQPPFVSSPPTEVAGPPPGELAFTGPSTYLWAAIIVFVLLDVGYLVWSVGRPERRRFS